MARGRVTPGNRDRVIGTAGLCFPSDAARRAKSVNVRQIPLSSSGRFPFVLRLKSPGAYRLKIRYDGDQHHFPSTARAPLTVL